MDTASALKHPCVQVDSPVAILYAAWKAQRNYGDWLDIIGHVSLSSRVLAESVNTL